MQSDMPTREPGTYCLVLRLDGDQRIALGRLGSFWFLGGWYLYLGSALGPGGVRGRLRRYLRAERQRHWHMDYLLDHAQVVGVLWAEQPERLECAWAAQLRGWPGARVPVPGFGASDCRCPGHLIHFAAEPNLEALAGALATVRQGLKVKVQQLAS